MGMMEPPSNLSKQQDFAEIAKSKLITWCLATIDPLLFVFQITVIYIIVLLADTAVLAVITWSLSDFASQNSYAALILDGIKLFSTLGTGIAYGLHLIYSLFHEGKHVAKAIRENSQGEGKKI